MSASPRFSVIIPARLESTRLPDKVLLDIGGRTMLQRVYEQALKSGAVRVVIATDNPRIAAVADGFGAESCITSARHNSGTERICEAVAKLALQPTETVVNLQADEPLAPPEAIGQVAAVLAAGDEMATLCVAIASADELRSPAVVKVVADGAGRALYFSRLPIPWAGASGDGASLPSDGLWMRHIGIYAYRVSLLRRWAELGPSALERSECLEQLRALSAGVLIRLAVVRESFPPGVDTAADLERVRHHFASVTDHGAD